VQIDVLEIHTWNARFARVEHPDRIVIDLDPTNTSVAAFSTRTQPEAPVSVTLTWAELARLSTPARFTIETVPSRLERLKADPWKAYWTTRQRLPAGAVRALETL
jgi:DNA primase